MHNDRAYDSHVKAAEDACKHGGGGTEVGLVQAVLALAEATRLVAEEAQRANDLIEEGSS